MPEIVASHSSTGCQGWPLKLRRILPACSGRTLNSSGFGEVAGAEGRWIGLMGSFAFASSGLSDGWPGVFRFARHLAGLVVGGGNSAGVSGAAGAALNSTAGLALGGL